MASNTLANVYARDQLDQALLAEAIRNSNVWNSGLVTIDPKLAEFVGAAEGRKLHRVGYKDQPDPLLTGNAAQATTHNPGYTDDGSTDLIPNASSTYEYDSVKSIVAYGLGQKEIMKTLNFLDDPISALNSRMTNYWSRYFDIYVINMLKGLFLDNVGNDSGDMVAGDGTAAISDDLIIDAFGTLGDAAELGGNIIILHSLSMNVLRKAQLIDSIPSAANPNVNFEYFQGNRCIVSDYVPVYTNATNDVAISILAKPGSVSFGQSDNEIIPSEIWRNPMASVGGGEEVLITRQQFAFECPGFSWEDDTVTGSAAGAAIGGSGGTKLWPCPADAALAANWDRVLDRKAIPISFLHTSEQPS